MMMADLDSSSPASASLWFRLVSAIQVAFVEDRSKERKTSLSSRRHTLVGVSTTCGGKRNGRRRK